MQQPDLSILIVNWNGEEYIQSCLDSVINTNREFSYEIIVVDNNSTDGSARVLQKYNNIKIIKLNENVMFAKANNIAYEASSGKYIALINPDVIVKDGVIDSIVRELRVNDDTAYTTVLYNQDNSVQENMHRSFPSFFRLFFSMLCIYKKRFCNSKGVRSYLLKDLDTSKDQVIEQAAGAFIFLRRAHIIRMGYLFDEKFPLFYNDVDLCYRLKKENITVLHKATPGVYHLKGVSVQKLKFNENLRWKLEGARDFFRKHGMYLDYILTWISIVIINIATSISSKEESVESI